MRELLNILKDITSGALPADELPIIMLWLFGKYYWLGLAVIGIAVAVWLAR